MVKNPKVPVTPETSPMATPAELAIRTQTAEDINEARRREEVAQRKRNQRARENAAKRLHERSKSQGQMWQENRQALTPEQLAELLDRQAEFVYLASAVNEVIDGLKDGALIGPPDGLEFPDALFEEVMAYDVRTNPKHKLVIHLFGEEFINLHAPENVQILELISSGDKDWWLYGAYTKFSHTTIDAFIKVVADFIRQNPDHEAFDPIISQRILAARSLREPRKTASVVRNISEEDRIPDGSEESWVEKKNNEERLRSARDLSRLPFKH
jgi:hypothetical protein